MDFCLVKWHILDLHHPLNTIDILNIVVRMKTRNKHLRSSVNINFMLRICSFKINVRKLSTYWVLYTMQRLKRMNFMREKRLLTINHILTVREMSRSNLYIDIRFVMTIVISDCLYSQKLGAFLENSGLYKTVDRKAKEDSLKRTLSPRH